MRRKLVEMLTRKWRRKQMDEWEKIFGEFDKTDYEKYTLEGLPSESTFYHGEIIKWSRDIVPSPKKALLAGEDTSAAKLIGREIKIDRINTAGLLEVDYRWDFEEDPPSMGLFDLIISYAILEHLLDPYKHVSDLAGLLSPDGFLIVHTVCPGFDYHRYPIDTCRFYPDWFEEIAKRLRLAIVKKRIKDSHIFYMYQKTDEAS